MRGARNRVQRYLRAIEARESALVRADPFIDRTVLAAELAVLRRKLEVARAARRRQRRANLARRRARRVGIP